VDGGYGAAFDPNGVVRVRIISKVTAEDLNITLQQLREAVG